MSKCTRRAFAFTPLIVVSLLAYSSSSTAAEPWTELPPSPNLPAATVSGPVHVNDIQMWRAEFGPVAVRPVIMAHGGVGNSNHFGAPIPYLTAAGFHVICVDSRGHGRSTRSPKPYSYELMAKDVVAMMDALHIQKADLVGLSDGAIIGIVMAIHNPERLNRVFAFGANTVPSGLIPDFDKTPIFTTYFARASDEYKSMSPTPDQFDNFLTQIGEMWGTQPNLTDEQLQAIHTPIVIADGRYDEIIKQSHDRYMAATIPNARLVILPGVSHFAIWQNSALVARAILDTFTADWDN